MAESAMTDLWWKNALVYGVDVKTFLDSDGDGIGDLNGLAAGLDYLAALGATCLWVLPVFPSPWRDDGYDVTDYLAVDPRLGDLGDFVSFTRAARQNGIHVIVDLPLNHTSDEHPSVPFLVEEIADGDKRTASAPRMTTFATCGRSSPGAAARR